MSFSPAPKLPCSRAPLFVLLLCTLAPLLLGTPAVVNAQWEPNRRLTYNDSASITSINNAWCVAAGPAGYVHVVWYDNRDGNWEIYYKRSTDFGASWDTADTRLTYAPDSSQKPSIASSGSFVHLVWVDFRDTLLGAEIFYKRSTDFGATWQTDTALGVVTPSSFYLHPSLAASGNQVHAVWDMNGDIYHTRSTDSGVSWTAPWIIVSSSGADFPSVAAHDSAVHVVWADLRSGRQRIYYKHSLDSGVTWSPETCLTTNSNTRTPCIAASGSNVHILWRGYHGSWMTYYRRSTDQGTTWSPETLLSRAGAIYPSVAASGPYVHGIWVANYLGNATLGYKRSTDSGTSWSPDTTLASISPNFIFPYASVAAFGPAVHVVWRDSLVGNFEIYYKRNPTGNSGVEVSSPISLSPCLPVPLSVVPNPFSFFATVPGHSSERFTLYDISGRRVGTYRGDRIGEGLRAGVYFMRALEGKTGLVRVVKIR